METTEEKNIRRNENLHTIEELQADGNKLNFYSVDSIRMKRGKTITNYVLKDWKDKFYWYPVSANTIQ